MNVPKKSSLMVSFKSWRDDILAQIALGIAQRDTTKVQMLRDMLKQTRHATRSKRALRYARALLRGRDPRRSGDEGLEACVCAYTSPNIMGRGHCQCLAEKYRDANPATWLNA